MGISCSSPTVPKFLVHVTRIKQKTLNIYYVPRTELDPVDTKIKKNGLICYKSQAHKRPSVYSKIYIHNRLILLPPITFKEH